MSFNAVEIAQILETPIGELNRFPYSEFVAEQRKIITENYNAKKKLYGFMQASSMARVTWIENNIFPLVVHRE